VEKEYGKQKVYFAVQNTGEVPSEAALTELDERIEVRWPGTDRVDFSRSRTPTFSPSRETSRSSGTGWASLNPVRVVDCVCAYVCAPHRS
jgi:hypothetical protein